MRYQTPVAGQHIPPALARRRSPDPLRREPPRRRPRAARAAQIPNVPRETLAVELGRLEQLARILEETERHGEAVATRGIRSRLESQLA